MESLEVERRQPSTLARPSVVKRIWRASVAGYFGGGTSFAGGTSFGPSPDESKAPEAPEAAVPGLTRKEAWTNLVLALIGCTVCWLPNIMAQCGYLLGPPLLLFSALLIIRTGSLICESCELVEDSSKARLGSLNSYEDLARAVNMYKAVLVTKNTVMISCLLVSQKFLTGALAGLIPAKVSKPLLRWTVIMPMFCVFALMKDLSQLSKIAWVGMVGMALELLGILMGCILGSSMEHDPPRTYSKISPKGDLSSMVGITLSAFIFGLAILPTVPSVRSQMQTPEEMPLVLRDAVLFTVLLYEIIMIWGYLAYGERVEENLVEQISDSFPKSGTVPSLGLFMNVSITTPLFFYCLFSVLEATGSDACRTQGTPPNTVARLLLVLMVTLVGWALPELLAIIGVFGSVFCVCNNIWFPILFYHKLRRRAHRPVPPMGLALNASLAIAGVLVFIYGLRGSLEKLAKEMKWLEANTTNATNATNATIIVVA